MYDPLAHQIGFAFLIAHGLEWLKRLKWFPLITEDTASLNRWISMLAAAVTSVGVTFATDATWASGGTITIHIPSGSVLIEALARFAGQAGLQEMIYSKAIQKPEPSVVVVPAVELKP